MSKPKAVIINDIHYNINNLLLASRATVAAARTALDLEVPLIIAGDLLDQKATIRGECANNLIDIFSQYTGTVFILAGNHDLFNSQAKENSLKFLSPYCHVISYPISVGGWHFIPYQPNPADFKAALSNIPKHELVIVHQSVEGAHLGDYVVDPSAVPRQWAEDYRIVSGHLHRKQDIKCGRPRKGAIGLWSYTGSPYTISFGEASDGPKGYSILLDNGLLEQVPLNLRKHVIVERTTKDVYSKLSTINHDDLLWVKVSGPTLELEKLNKEEIGKALIGHSNFKLDKIPTDEPTIIGKTDNQTDEQLMDELIDTSSEPDETKQRLKDLWREVMK